MGACLIKASVGPEHDEGTRKRLVRLQGADNPLIHILSIAQLMEINEAFNRFDRDGDGHIEAKELATVMRIMGMNPTSEEMTTLIESVDVDGNGKIELPEFANMMARQMLTRDGRVELEQAFKLFDADQSGYVTADEIRHFMMSAGGPEALTQAECDEMIRMADPNNDGKVSLEEFRGMECWKIPEDTMTRARRSRVATPRPDPAPAAPPAAASSAAAPPAAEPPAAEPPAAEPEAAAPEAAASSSEAAAPEAAAPEAAAPPAES